MLTSPAPAAAFPVTLYHLPPTQKQTGLCCRIGDRFASGRDMGRPSADQMRRFREGRAINYPTQLAATNQPAIDIAAYAECLYEAATGGRPQEVEYAQRHQYGSSILQLAGKQVDEMCDEELRHYAQEAYFDRSVEMMEGGGWQRYVDEVIAPLDPLLAAFLRPMFVCREDRPSIDDLLDHPYIAGECVFVCVRVCTCMHACVCWSWLCEHRSLSVCVSVHNASIKLCASCACLYSSSWLPPYTTTRP